MDRFVVQSLLGVGGMAAVYDVRHTVLGTRHALKLLHVPDPRYRARLAREGRMQARLDSPHVVPVTDVVEFGGALGLVMPRINGLTLRHLLDRRTSADPPVHLPWSAVDDLARGVLAGMVAAHRAGAVHRDLKPANVLLSVSGTSLVPCVADFGLVKLADPNEPRVTHTGERMGTPGYMSPEQVRSAAHVDARSDVFALGAVLYEVATSHRAFGTGSAFEVMRRIAEGRITPATDRRADTPPRIARALAAALTVAADQRPADATALAALWFDAPPEGIDAALAAVPQHRWPEEVVAGLRRIEPDEPTATTVPDVPVPPPAARPAAPLALLAGVAAFVGVVVLGLILRAALGA